VISLRHALSRAGRRVSSAQRPLPDFLILGAAKSGTTSLFEYLSAHPQVCPPSKKEVCFFAFHFDRGLGWYRSHFPTREHRARVARRTGRMTWTGEACAFYLYHPLAPGRAAETVPDAKLIVLLRDPVERAIAHYRFRARLGHETRSIVDAVAHDLDTWEHSSAVADHDTIGGHHHFRTYVTRGHYAEQLERWRKAFEPGQMLVIETSRLTRTGGEGFERILDFLGLDRWRPSEFIEYLAAPEFPPVDPELVARLRRHYEPRNRALWELIGERWDWES
jgi:hypothetical protein